MNDEIGLHICEVETEMKTHREGYEHWKRMEEPIYESEY